MLFYFCPRFPFSPNKEYVVEIKSDEVFLKTIKIPALINTPPTIVSNVFPSTDNWPANQLKIYIHFSAPMGLGNIYEHIKLFEADGLKVEKPFLEITPPLWDKSQQRLTLWFDPGRIKQHLSPNEKMGPPLEKNKKYRLVISKNAKDDYGRPLENDFEKTFYTNEDDRIKPDTQKWNIVFPKNKNTDPVTINFTECMDHGTLHSTLAILDENKKRVAGKTEISNSEKTWVFHPKNKWEAGKYYLMVSNKIEDLAGNNLKRLFDQNILVKEEKKKEKSDLEIEFFIK